MTFPCPSEAMEQGTVGPGPWGRDHGAGAMGQATVGLGPWGRGHGPNPAAGAMGQTMGPGPWASSWGRGRAGTHSQNGPRPSYLTPPRNSVHGHSGDISFVTAGVSAEAWGPIRAPRPLAFGLNLAASGARLLSFQRLSGPQGSLEHVLPYPFSPQDSSTIV